MPPLPPEGPPPGPHGAYPPWEPYPDQWPPPPPPGPYPPGPPPPGWQPGGAWPPPPGAAPGWVPTPAGWRAPPPGMSRRKLTAWIVAGVVALVTAIVVTAVLLAQVTAKPKSDEAQIRALITKATTTNSSDLSEFRELWCAKIQRVIDQVQQFHPTLPEPPSKSRGQVTVKSIQIDGDKATATIANTNHGKTRDAQMTFLKERGEWKLCL